MKTAALKTNRHYLRLLLEQAEALGMDSIKLLTELGYPEEADNNACTWVDNNLISALIKKIWHKSNDESLGISPEAIQFGTGSLIFDYMIAAETLGDLYRRGHKICKFLKTDILNTHLTTDHTNATLHIKGYVGEQDPNRFLMEFFSVTWHRFACWAIDDYIPLQQAFFCYPAPPHSHLYEEIFQCKILFNQTKSGYSFHKKHLKKPVCRNRQELNIWLKDSPADLLYMPGRDTTITNHIKRSLNLHLDQNRQMPTFDQTCYQLNINTQVVRRRLEEEGTSFQKIKDEVRLETIKELLGHSDHNISDITALSGFTETASLTRAFKKWTGITPAQYRKRQKNKP